MSVAASGAIATVVETLAAMVSNCATFQAVTRAANAAAALAKIYEHGAAATPTRPFALVEMVSYAPVSLGKGTHDHYYPAGRLALSIEIANTVAAALSAAADTTHVTASDLIGYPDDYFNGRTLRMESGAAAGSSAVISDFTGATGALVLETALTALPTAADTFKIVATTPAQAMKPFLNSIGNFVEELEALSGTGGCLALRNIQLADFGRSDHGEEATDYCGARVEMDFGL